MSNLKESPSELKDIEMVGILLDDHGKLLVQMKKVVDAADAAGDEGSIDLVGAYIRELEKTSWMLDAWRQRTTATHKEID